MELALRTFYHVPVVGWLTKDAVKGKSDAKYYFMANIGILYAVLLYVFGYPLLIVTLLAATAPMLTTIVVFTAIDLFASSVRAQPSDRKHR
jgi:hypothetical protein